MVIRLFITSALLVAGCRADDGAGLERLAREANPILARLRPTVAVILASGAEDPASTRRAIEACGNADEALEDLRQLVIPDSVSLYHEKNLSDLAADLIDYRRVECRALDADSLRPGNCRHWCVEHWRALAREVDRLRDSAHRAGARIEIEPLVPRAKP